MEVKSSPNARRTQADRSAATKAALVAAARDLFAEHGFGGVGTEAIVRAAGVTRGAMYHQFADKTELFEAVLIDVETEVMNHIVATVGAASTTDPVELMHIGASAMLDHSGDPHVQRIMLVDGPSVLGWPRWREICMHYAAGMVGGMIQAAIDSGQVEPRPVTGLAHALIAALDEAAMYIVAADDPVAARAEMDDVVRWLIDSLTRR